MRCPHCRKKVHPDDIYCVFCGASLRRRSFSDPWDSRPSQPARPQSGKDSHRELARDGHFRLGLVFAILLFLLVMTVLPAIVIGINTAERIPEPDIPEEPEIYYEDADRIFLSPPTGTWEDFSVAVEAVSLDPYTGELEIIYTAENHSDRSIVSFDPLVTVDGITLDCLMYLEVQPGETVKDYLWVSTDGLQALGIGQVPELALTLELRDGEDSTVMGQTSQIRVPLQLDLPEMPIQQIHHAIYNDNGLEVAIAGLAADPEYGELTLYTLMKNGTGKEVMVSMDNARCGDTEVLLAGYHVLPPDTTLLGRDVFYDIPFTDGMEITFDYKTEIYEENYTETGTGELSLILNVDGTLAYMAGSTGHERVY